MLKAISMFAMGLVLGGLFMNAKFTETTKGVTTQAEVIYGTRVDSQGTLQVLTSR